MKFNKIISLESDSSTRKLRTYTQKPTQKMGLMLNKLVCESIMYTHWNKFLICMKDFGKLKNEDY